MAMGRPAKPYAMQDGTIVPGLYRCPDGRWRVNATAAKFTEHNERLAIKKFRELPYVPPELATLRGETSKADLFAEGEGWSIYKPGARVDIDTQEIWDFVRESLLTRPLYVAQKTGIPELATFGPAPAKLHERCVSESVVGVRLGNVEQRRANLVKLPSSNQRDAASGCVTASCLAVLKGAIQP